MGLEIDREEFSPEEFGRFEQRLDRCLVVLRSLVERPGFGVGPPSIGAELEVTLLDPAARPLPLNEAVLRESLDERMTAELDRFNLECNLRHCDLAGRPFEHMRRELMTARAEFERAAGTHGGRIAMIGILPTLVEPDLHSRAMTDRLRYRALSRSLRARRNGPFLLDIDGEDPLKLACHDVTFEGAATSFQLHLRVDPDDFADVFDAAQLATAPVLAAAANSPTFLGHRLWDETRVALFKQAVDDRDRAGREVGQPARVSFGKGWLRDGPIELFEQAVADYSALLPVVYDEDPEVALSHGRVPRLEEIRLHQGTVWHWNRPVYDPHDSGHVRIELRSLPSGPTEEDMLANAAFLIGLSLGLAPGMASLRKQVDFRAAHRNFYRAAQSGLDAQLHWPEAAGGSGDLVSVRLLVPRLAEIARKGLRAGGVEPEDSDPLIDRIVERVMRGQTGASWQRARLASLSSSRPDRESLVRMLEEYLDRSAGGEPVHGWGLA